MNRIRQIIFIELGTFLFAFAIGAFILPGKILTGGVAGVTAILVKFIPVAEDYLAIIINTSLFIIGSIFLGRDFFFNTIFYSATYPFALLFVTRMLPQIEIDPLLAAIYGGILGGVAVGILFRNGGSSGGMDVIALILEKYFGVKVSTSIMITDSLTVLGGLFAYGFNSVLIGLISVYLTTFAMERTMNMYSGIQAHKFEIISERYEEISADIMKNLDRGTTVYDIQGGYTGKSKKMLMVVVADEEYKEVKDIIDKYDPDAFVIISDTRDVNGEGFTYEPRL